LPTGADQYSIIGCHIFNNFWHGIYTEGTKNGVINGNVVYNNSQAEVGTYHGIVVQSSDISVIGNRCFDNQGTKTQQYGILIPDGSTYNTVIGNTCRGNNSTGVVNGGGVTNEVANNTT